MKKGRDIVKYIEAQRMKWWENLKRVEVIKLIKKVTDWKHIGKKPKDEQRIDGEMT